MDIICHNKVITRKQVKECIKLLGDEYLDLPFKLIIYKDVAEVQKEWENEPNMLERSYEEVIYHPATAPPGICTGDPKMIRIYPFNMGYSETSQLIELKMMLIYFLFHEIRHAYQHEYGLFKDDIIYLPYGEDAAKYASSPHELDAYQFAQDKADDPHIKSRIREILEIDYLYSEKRSAELAFINHCRTDDLRIKERIKSELAQFYFNYSTDLERLNGQQRNIKRSPDL